VDWRDFAEEWLAGVGIRAISPMRQKQHLCLEQSIADSYPDGVLSCDRGIMTRDRSDVRRCDVVLANLLGAKRVSVGTCIEFGWADAWRKPIVAVMETSGNFHEHSMIREAVGFRVNSLGGGLQIVQSLLA
jgi:nucleoside 2-deoxyribosyltransferase